MSQRAGKEAVAIGQSMRVRRIALHLSQRDLAHAAGTTAAAVSHIERGARNLSVGLLVRIADALQCPPNDLLTGTDAETPSSHMHQVVIAMKGFPLPLQKEVADFCAYLKHRERRSGR